MKTREALEKSIVLWDWLAANPGKNKPDGILACFPKDMLPLYNCYLCESVEYIRHGSEYADCSKCPVWPADQTNGFGCEADDSPYSAWLHDKHTPGAASAVADLCRKALEDLE